MAKPTKKQKDDLTAAVASFKAGRQSTGHIVRKADVSSDDERLAVTIEFPEFPGEVYTIDTPVIGPEHPETKQVETAEQYIKRGGLDTQFENIRAKRAAGRIGPR